MRSNKDLIQSKCKFPTCQEHDLELEYYCESCEKLVCVQCTGEHEDHKYDVVKKVANKYQNNLKEVTAPIEVMIEDLSKLHDSIEDVRTAIRQQGDEINEKIDFWYDEMFQKLLKQKEQVKQQVCNTVLQKEKAIIVQLEELMHTQEDILNIKRIRNAVEGSCDQEVLSAKSQLFYSLERLTEDCEKLGRGPIESANITVTPVNEPLPQIVEHYATINSLSFDVKRFNSFAQQGQIVTLEIITKDGKGDYYPRGGCKVTAVVTKTRTREKTSAQIIDNNNGCYMIYFLAQQLGKIQLSLFANGHEIKGSPFGIVVQENPMTPNKIITSLDDSFGQLCGIACSNNGTFAVADWLKNCVHIFDSQGILIKKLGSHGSGFGEFKCPWDVAFDNDNHLYVVESQNHRVQKFGNYGDYLLWFGGKGSGEGQLNQPLRITTHQDKVYVADRQNSRISVFESDGKFCTIIGHQQLSRYFDIAVNVSNEILAADWKHHCIYVFTLDGFCTNKMSICKGAGGLELKDPCSLTTDPNGFILIADTSVHNHSVSIFDKIGNCICCFGSKGSNDNQFKFPSGIAVGPNRDIYISDTGNNRIQIFPSYI